VMYYLSLGDSFAAGEQPIGDPDNRFRTDDGYADQLYQLALVGHPKLRHVKLGCSGGESTVTFIHGGVCTYPHGSQLDEAVAFLHAHRQFVAFVTIDIGVNDFTSHEDPAAIPEGLRRIGANLPVILGALREAAGPDVPIVGATIYDPLLAYWLTFPANPAGRDLAMLSVQLIAGTAATPGINDFIAAIYASALMPVADVEGAFFTTSWTPEVPLPGFGDAPLNVFTICAYTWVCAPPPLGPNNHPNHDGYRAMALAYAAELGL